MERKTIWLVGALTLVLLLVGVGTSLAVVDKTGTVPAAATVGASTSLTVEAKKISDNSIVTAVNFGTITELTNKLAPQYVQISVQSNALGSNPPTKNAWGLEIYTNNFAAPPSTTTWGFQYGGMVDTGADGGHRAPMAWQAYRSTSTVVTDPPANLTGWTYLKDRRDLDIPDIPPGTSPDNESWGTAHTQGYTNIAYGGPDYLMVVEPGSTGKLDTDNKLALYLGGLFGSAPTDTYSTTIGIDLYHE